MSMKWLSNSIKRDEIFVYYFNEKESKYVLENKNRNIDELNIRIEVDVNHFTKFILTYWKLDWAQFSRQTIKSRAPFTDIDGHWAELYVERLFALWVLDNRWKYYPEINLKRVELLKIAMVMFWHWESANTSKLSFVDIDKNSWYAWYLAKAVELWIVTWDAWWKHLDLEILFQELKL